MIVIATHAVFYDGGEIHGPADAVARYLRERSLPYILIKHPLAGQYQSVMITNKKKEAKQVIGARIGGIARYPYDIYLNARFLLQHPEVTIIIGVDPLNCIAGILVKPFRWQLQVVYFTADFALTRFPNPLLNGTYHLLDRISAKRADACWSVSSRIVAYRKKQGVIDAKNLHVPNSPPFYKIKRKRIEAVIKADLMLVSNLNAGIPYDALFSAIKTLRTQFPLLRLLIIGGGDGREQVEQKIAKSGLEGTVVLLGPQPHAKVHEMMATCGIGIALYTDDAPWRYFSDSMKARDYLACGMPVLISGDLATVDDIALAKAGLAIKPTASAIVKAVTTILTSDESYASYRNRAIALAKRFDIDGILDEVFAKLVIQPPARSASSG